MDVDSPAGEITPHNHSAGKCNGDGLSHPWSVEMLLRGEGTLGTEIFKLSTRTQKTP